MSSKESTRKELDLALRRIQQGGARVVDDGRRLSIAAVAEEAGVSPALIHNSHPEFAEEVRRLVGRARRSVEGGGEEKLMHAKKRVIELMAQVELLETKVRKIAVENLSLSEENRRLRKLLSRNGKNTLKDINAGGDR